MELAKIFAPVAQEMKAVDRELKKLMRSVGEQTMARRGKAGILDRIVQHPFSVPGKRIRPALVLLTAHAAGCAEATGRAKPAVSAAAAANTARSKGRGAAADPGRSLVALAAAVEVLHAASLVHDDIIDNAESRRHQVSLNRRFGNRVAVLAGDILYTHFFSLVTGLVGVEPPKRFSLLDIFLDTTKAMCMGEILAQEVAAAARPLTFDEYLEIATDKTAVLFAACCRGAAILCDAGPAMERCMGDFGLHFGLTFQMADDLVDEDHGLDPGVDLKGAARSYADKARAGVAAFAPSRYRDSLHSLVDYVINQAFP